MFNEISNWLDNILKQEVSNSVVAFCFYLYEDGNDSWSIELVGTERFDADDEDWSCDKVTDFATRDNPFVWNKLAKWDEILGEIILILNSYLEKGMYAEVLKSKSGVGVGFVDGDIEILYQNKL